MSDKGQSGSDRACLYGHLSRKFNGYEVRLGPVGADEG